MYTFEFIFDEGNFDKFCLPFVRDDHDREYADRQTDVVDRIQELASKNKQVKIKSEKLILYSSE